MQMTVGILGLGIMGLCFARHLIEDGFRVCGYDPSADAARRFEKLGGGLAASPAEVADRASVLLSCLPADHALDQVVSGTDGLLQAERKDFLLVECGTLSLEVKLEAERKLRAKGNRMLDCPVSGTGVQAAGRDVVFYASGEEEAVRHVEPLLRRLGREVISLGQFGNGMRMKLLSNLLVAIHNVAAAEAILLGRKAGFEPEVLLRAISAGAGTSRMFEVRGPMMLAGDFDSGASSRLSVFQKDLRAIEAFCKEMNTPTPLFCLCETLYRKAIANGWLQSDPGVVIRAIEQMQTSDEPSQGMN